MESPAVGYQAIFGAGSGLYLRIINDTDNYCTPFESSVNAAELVSIARSSTGNIPAGRTQNVNIST